VEEDLLAALLESNEALFQAINLYDDLERVAGEREAEEISRRDVRMDRRVRAFNQSNDDHTLNNLVSFSTFNIRKNMEVNSNRRHLTLAGAHLAVRHLHLLIPPPYHFSNLLSFLPSHILYLVFPVVFSLEA